MNVMKWTGRSGKAYLYNRHPWGTPMKDVGGNYIYVRHLPSGGCVPVYIGQGNLVDRCNLQNHHQGACIRLKGANEIHTHVNASEPARRSEETDLLANHSEAYKPNGCNEREGG